MPEPIIHLSPSNLVAFDDIDRAPWMTVAKFKEQFLKRDTMSEAAAAGNAVHEAVLAGSTVVGSDGVVWPGDSSYDVDDTDCNNARGRLSEYISQALGCPSPAILPPWGNIICEAPFVLMGEDFGITKLRVRLSARLDMIVPFGQKLIIEAKTSSQREINPNRYLESAQFLAYSVAFDPVPVALFGMPIKILKRGRRASLARITIDTERIVTECRTRRKDDKERLRDLVLRCAHHVMNDDEMRERATTRTAPELL